MKPGVCGFLLDYEHIRYAGPPLWNLLFILYQECFCQFSAPKNAKKGIILPLFREVSFFTRRGAPENWGGSGTLSKIKREDQKIFQIKKGGSLIFFKEIKYFVKHSWNSC